MTRMQPGRGPARRTGFTMVELLVVITIIAILVSLTTAAVVYAINKGRETMARTEIGQLEVAIAACKSTYKVPYLPSRLVLCEDPTKYAGFGATGTQSYQFLQRMFGPRIAGRPIDWNGNGNTGDWNGVLEGHQCLVFFLGGIPDATGGFSTNPSNPADPTPLNRRQAFYEFKSTRLVKYGPAGAGGFFSYLDPYSPSGLPIPNVYVYFSSGQGTNSYNPSANPATADNPSILADVTGPILVPYMESATRFANPNGFQIITAGRDTVFGASVGPGNTLVWTRPTGSQDVRGKDDQANFASYLLGSEDN